MDVLKVRAFLFTSQGLWWRIPAPQKLAKENVIKSVLVFLSNDAWDSSQRADLLKESENQES